MKPSFRLAAGLVAAASLVHAADPAPAPTSIADAILHGKPGADLRLRHEHVDQEGIAGDAEALTLRARVSWRTLPFRGFEAFAEGAHVEALVDEYAFPGGGEPGRPVVADPPATELAQGWVAQTVGKTRLSVGRQDLVLDNARFVGNVGWRQNPQTFDALVAHDTTFDATTLTYAFLHRVKRVFGDLGPQPHWESSSHVIHVARAGLPLGTWTGYAHLFDFANAPASSCATVGAHVKGSNNLGGGLALEHRAELALQRDHGDNPSDYEADYVAAELALKSGPGRLALGWERLGAGSGVGFKTPLATLHAFNGWADLFLATPAGGLQDVALQASTTWQGLTWTAVGHLFLDDGGSATLGREIDLLASWKPDKRMAFTAKLACYEAGKHGTDTLKAWLQAELSLP